MLDFTALPTRNKFYAGANVVNDSDLCAIRS